MIFWARDDHIFYFLLCSKEAHSFEAAKPYSQVDSKIFVFLVFKLDEITADLVVLFCTIIINRKRKEKCVKYDGKMQKFV